MVAALSLFPVHPPDVDEEQRILLSNVPWSAYVVLRDAVESSAVRMTYLKGWLEITRSSRSHENTKKQIARLIERFCLERGIPLFGCGSSTFRSEERQLGLEPDASYARGSQKRVPDIAIEVVATRGSIDKLEVYRGLGVSEVWVFENGSFCLFALRGDHYETVGASTVLGEIDLTRLAHHAQQPDSGAALRAFRDEIRSGV